MEPLGSDDPEELGPYRLVARLGAGGMGRVYLARSPEGRTVAVTITEVLGSPERPLPPEAVRAKFIDCRHSVPNLLPEQDTALWDAVSALETFDDVRPLVGLSAPLGQQ